VRDIVDAEWDAARLTGLKLAILYAFIPRAIQSQVSEVGDAVPLDAKLIPTIRKHVTAMGSGQHEAKQALERVRLYETPSPTWREGDEKGPGAPAAPK
jgi:hypothetical protein